MIDSSMVAVVTTRQFAFFTNHTEVLLAIAYKPDIRMREIAVFVDITERAVQRIVEDLVAGGCLSITKDGRRNHYEIQPAVPLGTGMTKHRSVGDLVEFCLDGSEAGLP